jgi:phage repressor protein C with HTH and peptisase S24 domain
MNRIREWRQKKGWSLQQLAEASDTSRAQIDKLERGERRLTLDWMLRLAKPLDCLPADLLPQLSGSFASTDRLIPVRCAARGGDEQEMFLEDGPIDHRPAPTFVSNVRDAYAIYVVGESMTPMYRPGQLLYVNPHKPLTPGRGVVITKFSKAVLIKELVRATSFGLVLREYQPKIREFTVAHRDIATAHLVVGAEEPGN